MAGLKLTSLGFQGNSIYPDKYIYSKCLMEGILFQYFLEMSLLERPQVTCSSPLWWPLDLCFLVKNVCLTTEKPFWLFSSACKYYFYTLPCMAQGNGKHPRRPHVKKVYTLYVHTYTLWVCLFIQSTTQGGKGGCRMLAGGLGTPLRPEPMPQCRRTWQTQDDSCHVEKCHSYTDSLNGSASASHFHSPTRQMRVFAFVCLPESLQSFSAI